MKTLTYALLVFGFVENYVIANSSAEKNSLASSVEDLSIEKRIFGGVTAARNEYAYVAKLYINFQPFTRTICSGVALTTKIIITVANCVSRTSGEKAINVVAFFPVGGSYRFENRRNEIIVHPKYNGLFSANVAILRKDSQRSEYIRGLGNKLPTIPVIGDANAYTSGIIAGWGKTTELSNLYSFKLQYAPVTLMDTSLCLNHFSTLSMDNQLLCAETNIAGICMGDDGGPLLVANGNPRPLLLGLSVLRRSTCNNRDSTIPSAFYDLRSEGAVWLRSTFPEIF